MAYHACTDVLNGDCQVGLTVYFRDKFDHFKAFFVRQSEITCWTDSFEHFLPRKQQLGLILKPCQFTMLTMTTQTV
jgi:hypothetical protein